MGNAQILNEKSVLEKLKGKSTESQHKILISFSRLPDAKWNNVLKPTYSLIILDIFCLDKIIGN